MKKDDLSKILELKEAYSKKIYDKVTAFRPVLVITEKGVSDLVQPFFNKVGVTAIRRLRKSDNMRVARTYGAPRANQMDEIAEEDIGTRAGFFEVRKLGDEYFTSFEQCRDPKTCTIPLRSASKDIPNEGERAKVEAEDDEDLDGLDKEKKEEIQEEVDKEAAPKEVKPLKLEREKGFRREAAGFSRKRRKRTRRIGKRKR